MYSPLLSNLLLATTSYISSHEVDSPPSALTRRSEHRLLFLLPPTNQQLAASNVLNWMLLFSAVVSRCSCILLLCYLGVLERSQTGSHTAQATVVFMMFIE